MKSHDVYYRKFPVDMAAFAINVRSILARPSVLMCYDRKGERVSELGFLETRFFLTLCSESSDFGVSRLEH